MKKIKISGSVPYFFATIMRPTWGWWRMRRRNEDHVQKYYGRQYYGRQHMVHMQFGFTFGGLELWKLKYRAPSPIVLSPMEARA